MSTRLRGFDELERELDRLAGGKAAQVGQTAINTAARHFRKILKAKVPVGKSDTVKSRRVKGGAVNKYNYGRWRDNIRVRPLRRRGGSSVRVQVTMGAAFWSKFYEFGTRKQPARPLIRPTFDGEEETMIRIIGQALAKGLVKRGARASLLDIDFGDL